MLQTTFKPRLSFWQIINMNVGFLGIQYSFGLQQTNMSPIYSFLGANPEEIPLLNMAGPMTGLIIQPIVGAMSDKTLHPWGRRRPYFMIGAVLCSLCLFAMPFSSSLWMAAGLLWILDAGNNITMEPYRAFVSDKLPEDQHPIGFLSQSFFTGLGITLANLTPGIMVWLGLIGISQRSSNHIPYLTYASFMVGAVVSIASVAWSFTRVKENPLSQAEIEEIKNQPSGIFWIFKDIAFAFKEMPDTMKRLGLVYLFNWYGMFIYWQFITLCLAKTIFHTEDPTSDLFTEAQLLTGKVNGLYNIFTFCFAFFLAWFSGKLGARMVHFGCLLLAGCGLFLIPHIQNPIFLFVPMAGFGLGWASMMGTPYIILAGKLPMQKTGIYMGILNMFIVLPMLLETITFRYIYTRLLDSDPTKALQFAGLLLTIAAFLVLRIRQEKAMGAAPDL